MTLGILINSNSAYTHASGIAEEAIKRGHRVKIFCMDEGTGFLCTEICKELNNAGVEIAYCDYSKQCLGIEVPDLPDAIVCGSQYDNAKMVHEADKVIVL